MAIEFLVIPLIIGLLIFFFFAIAILTTVFWILMLVDAAKRKFKEENEKIVWILVIALTGIIGSIVYYFAVKSKK